MSPGALRVSKVATLALAILAVIPTAAEAASREWQFPPALLASSLEARKSDPLAFAAAVPLGLGVEAGEWRSLPSGQAVWQLRLNSPGARSLSLLLDTKQLPQDAILYWRAEPAGDVQGPFQAPFSSRLWLPLVRGDRAVLEVRLPERDRARLQLQVVDGFHGFRGPGLPAPGSKGRFGTGESCNINSACADGNDWRSEIRSTVLLTVNNVALCSGTLLNNSRQDGRPLLLTAKHCFGATPEIDGMRAYFNIEQACCPDAPLPQATQSLEVGAVLLIDDATDLALLELEETPPDSFHAYFSGWDARPEPVPRSGVSIHHPQGDDKRISTFSTAARRVDAQEVGGFFVDGWEVQWSRGTTEPGSSGSGLWNQDHLLVGQLAGGSGSCSDPTGKDTYGRLERAWARKPALQSFLAPTSTALFMPGMDSGTAPSPASCKTEEPEPTPEPEPKPVPRADKSGGGGALSASLFLALLLALRRSVRSAREPRARRRSLL